MLPLLRVLVLIDTIADSDMLAHELRRAGFELMLRRATTEAAYLAALESPLDLILADNALPAFDAMRALQILRTSALDIPLIVVTESASEASAIECVSLGAVDFLFKDRPARLGSAVVRALDQRELRVHARAADVALHTSAAINQAVLDSLTAHIAVLNVHGVIVAVNQAWQRFARENGDQDVTHTDVGINYLDVCDPAAGLDSVPVAQGIAAVLAHELDQFMIEYPCHSPHEQRWFIMRVTPLAGEYQGAVVSHEDITARRRSDATRALLAAVVDSSDDAIISIAPDGTVMSWNSGAEHVYGYRAEHMLGQPIARLRPPAMQDAAAQLYEQLARDEITTHVETVRRRNDGQLIDVALTISTINDASGGISGFSTISRDISARKRDERVLHQKASFIQLFQEVAAAANQATSLDQALQTAVDAICTSIGWPVGHVYLPDPDLSGALLPTTIWHLEDPQRFTTFRTITEIVRLAPGIGLPGQVMASRKPAWIADMILDISTPRTRVMQKIGVRAGFALPVLLGDDVAAVLEFFATEAIMPDDALLEVLHHVSTQLGRVVERARAEAALRESEERFRVLFAHSPDAIVLLDPHDSDISWSIVECNDVACRMNGYTRAELIGQSIDILNTKIDTLAGRAIYIAELRQAGTLQFEAMHRRKDGSLFPIEVVSSLIVVAGREMVLGIDRDISERRRAEDALRAAEAQYRALVEQIPAIIYTAAIDAHSSTSYVSPQIETILGFSPEEWLGDPEFWLTQVHPDERDSVLETVGRSHVTDVPVPVEYRSYTRDSRLVWLRDIARVVRDEAGQPLFVQGIALDITERKQAEAALAEREAYFRALIEHSADAIMLLGADGIISYGSPATSRILGYALHDFVGHNAFEFIALEDHAQIAQKILHIVDVPEATVTVQARVRHADGSWHDLEGRFTNLLHDPAVRAIVNNYRDVTERKRAEVAIRESERRYRTLASNFPNGAVVLFDHDLRFTIADGTGLADIDLSRERLEGHTLWEIYPPEASAVNEPIFRAALAGTPSIREVTTGELTLVIHTLPVRDEHGEIIAGMLMSQNITERKRIEEALRMSAARFRAVWESAHDAMVLSDPDGMVLQANPAYYQLYGYVPDQIIGQPHSIIFPAEQRAAAMEEYQTFFRIPQSLINVESIVIRADGTECWIESSVSFIVQDGQRTALLSLTRDITERKHMEAALIDERAQLARRVDDRTADLSAANAELARTARLKDEFLASMSHELRTPLNAVLGLSEALQEEIYGAINDRQRRSLQGIEESGRHLLELINDILDLAKIGAGKLELNLEPASVELICQASLRLVAQIAYKKQLSVDLTLDPTVTLLTVDARRVKQILVNLLSNAVKFTPEGGSIGLALAGDVTRQAVDLTVWDTGIGIAHEHLSNLFQPFVQLDSRLARQYEGTGLGLALVYRMVELHGGSIAVTSEVGVGSRFTVSLPWLPAATGDQHNSAPADLVIADAPPTLPMRASPPLVLLAEDNEATITMIADYLGARGYQVVAVRNGAEAIERARAARPAIVLMDIQMPGMDGIEATRRIRTIDDLVDVPIIALTALAMPGDRERCLAAGASAYLSKPVSLHALASLIATTLHAQINPQRNQI